MSALNTQVFQVKGMSCSHCVMAVKKALGSIEGVEQVEVDLASGKVTVSCSAQVPESVIAAAIEDAGYEVV